MFGNHCLCGLLEEGAHEKSPKCLGGNLGDFGEFCKGLRSSENKREAFSDDLSYGKRCVFGFCSRMVSGGAEFYSGLK